jgi:glycosyltransferase involved in cell wall biosynthesis
MKAELEVAFVTDALPAMGGSEKVLLAALELFPRARIHTLVYHPEKFAGTPLEGREIITSFINNLPFASRAYRKYLPLMPRAIEAMDLDGYDLVISFSYAVAHGARPQAGARHLSYNFTPMRYAWRDLGLNGGSRPDNPILEWLLQNFRNWDQQAARRVDRFAAVSKATAERIRRAYRREAEVIYPPVDLDRFRPAAQREAYYISIGRLVPHKRLDLLVEAFSRLGLPLVVVGEGPEYGRLKHAAGPNVQLIGRQPDAVVADLVAKARGFVTAAEEDFGIAIVEAQAAGCPVLAYGRGGALETVQEMKTGLFFQEQSLASLIQAMQLFEQSIDSFGLEDLTANASRFSKARFLTAFSSFVAAEL